MSTPHIRRTGLWTCVAIILVGLMIHMWIRSGRSARSRANASTTLSSYLRQADAAKDQYALENHITSNITPAWADLTPYLKHGSNLEMSGGRDPFGNPILIGGIREQLRVHPRTKKILEEATGGDWFWGPYS